MFSRYDPYSKNPVAVLCLPSVARSRQVYIELIVEALLIILSYPNVTSDLSTQMLVQTVRQTTC
jgi:hypothetical protein